MTTNLDPERRGSLFAGPAPDPVPAPPPPELPPIPVAVPDPGPRLDALERRADHAEGSVGRLDLRIHGAEVRLDRLERRSDEHDPRFADLETRIAGLQAQISPFLARVQTGVAGFANDMRALRDRLASIETALASAGDLESRPARSSAGADARVEPAPPATAGRLRLVSCPGGRFLVDPDEAAGYVLSAGGVWEPELGAVIERIGRPDRVAIDIGAGIGIHSVAMSRRFREVVAIETSRPAFHVLCGNLALNDCQNVRALDLTPGMAPADGTTIDGLGLHDVGLVRIGGGKHLLSVLTGAEETVRRFRPVILLGTDADIAEDRAALLARLGYRPETSPSIVHSGDRLILAMPDQT